MGRGGIAGDAGNAENAGDEKDGGNAGNAGDEEEIGRKLIGAIRRKMGEVRTWSDWKRMGRL